MHGHEVQMGGGMAIRGRSRGEAGRFLFTSGRYGIRSMLTLHPADGFVTSGEFRVVVQGGSSEWTGGTVEHWWIDGSGDQMIESVRVCSEGPSTRAGLT